MCDLPIFNSDERCGDVIARKNKRKEQRKEDQYDYVQHQEDKNLQKNKAVKSCYSNLAKKEKNLGGSECRSSNLTARKRYLSLPISERREEKGHSPKDFNEGRMSHCGALPITPPQSPEFTPLYSNCFPKKTTIFQPPVQFRELGRSRDKEAQSAYFTDSEQCNDFETQVEKAELSTDGRFSGKVFEQDETGLSQMKDINESVTSDYEVNNKEQNNSSEKVACKIFGLLSLQGPRERR